MKNIGIILPHLSSSQKAYMAITFINNVLGTQKDFDFTIFYENLLPPCTKPLCATVNISEVWSFGGHIISTTLDNTSFSIKAIAPKRKLFYVWDLEWLSPKHSNYLENLSIYRHKDVELIARSKSHQNALENYCNRRVNAVIPDFNLYHIIDYLERTEK